MVSVYTLKRKEPRVKLVVRVTVTVPDGHGAGASFDTTTIDVSPWGASVCADAPIAPGTIVRFSAKRYPFATRALVRSVAHNQDADGYCVGLEYLDETNPIVGWPKRAEAPAVREPVA